jgi:hypothetical protein
VRKKKSVIVPRAECAAPAEFPSKNAPKRFEAPSPPKTVRRTLPDRNPDSGWLNGRQPLDNTGI